MCSDFITCYHEASVCLFSVQERHGASSCSRSFWPLHPHVCSALQHRLLVDFFFCWVTMRAVSVWHSCTWTMHHTPGTSLIGCRSFALGICSSLQCSQMKLSITLQDMTAAADVNTYYRCVKLVQDQRWHYDSSSTHQRQSCQAWIAVQMGRNEQSPWFLVPDQPEWHGGQICSLWTKKRAEDREREVMEGRVE